jgi:hypothetical protein
MTTFPKPLAEAKFRLKVIVEFDVFRELKLSRAKRDIRDLMEMWEMWESSYKPVFLSIEKLKGAQK